MIVRLSRAGLQINRRREIQTQEMFLRTIFNMLFLFRSTTESIIGQQIKEP